MESFRAVSGRFSEALGFGANPTDVNDHLGDARGSDVGNPMQSPAVTDAQTDTDVENGEEGDQKKKKTKVVKFDLEDLPDDKKHGAHPKNNKFMTVSLIINTMIGSGVLGLPKVYADAGVACATFMIILGGFLIWIGMVALIDAGLKADKMDYSALAKHCLGTRGETLVDISIVIYNLGGLMSYIIVLGSTWSTLLLGWGCQSEVGCGLLVMSPLLILFIVFPVCTNREFGHLAFSSLFSVSAVTLVVLLVVIGGPIHGQEGTFPVHGYVKGGILTQVGTIFFALNCAFASFQTYTSMATGTPKEWRSVAGYACCIGAFLLFITGLSGYLAFGPDTKGIILENFTGHYADFFRMMLVVHMCLYIPIDFTTMRESTLKLWGVPGGKLSDFTANVKVTGIMLGATTALVMILYAAGFASGEAFDIVLNFTGGAAASLVGMILPGYFYLNIVPKPADDAPIEQRVFYYSVPPMLAIGCLTFIVVPIFAVIPHKYSPM
jgi:amino acid permease